jgi:hypothetical protein
MPDMNPSSDIAGFVQTVYERAMLVARENTLAVNLVTVYADRSGTAARSNSEYGTATIQAIAETDDLTSQSFTPSVLSTLTPAEAGGQFFVTDLRRETDPNPVLNDAAIELGMAVADKVDRDIFSNFSSLTGGTVGASGTAITWGYFSAMLARLVARKAPRPYVFVCHPYQWDVLARAVSQAAASRTNVPEYLMEAVARNYFMQTVSGVDIFVTSNVPLSSTDARCAMFSRPALAYDLRRAARLEPERDASRRGYELNMTTVYAHGVWRPTYGIQGLFDATAPES